MLVAVEVKLCKFAHLCAGAAKMLVFEPRLYCCQSSMKTREQKRTKETLRRECI